MPWLLMDLNLLQVGVMVVDTSKTSGSRHALIVDVHWSLGSRCAMIVTQSILYNCRMCTYRHIYCFNRLSYIYFDMSSAMSNLFCVKIEPIWQPSCELDAEISDWGSFVWTHTKLEGPVTFFSGSHSRDCMGNWSFGMWCTVSDRCALTIHMNLWPSSWGWMA